MKASELEWHKGQAERIRETDRTVKKAEQANALYWWQVGERLNGIYGFCRGRGGDTKTVREGNIPFLDLEEITGLYGVQVSQIQRARVFHKLAKSETEAVRVIDDYGTWSNIRDGFVHGHSADEARKRVTDQGARNNARAKALRSRSHIMNVDDDIRDALILNGLSDEEAREAIRLFIRQAGWRQIKLIWDNREQLREWHRMKA